MDLRLGRAWPRPARGRSNAQFAAVRWIFVTSRNSPDCRQGPISVSRTLMATDFDLTACRPGSGRIPVLFYLFGSGSDLRGQFPTARLDAQQPAQMLHCVLDKRGSWQEFARQFLPAGQFRSGGRLGDQEAAVLQDRATMPPLGTT